MSQDTQVKGLAAQSIDLVSMQLIEVGSICELEYSVPTTTSSKQHPNIPLQRMGLVPICNGNGVIATTGVLQQEDGKLSERWDGIETV